MKMSQVLPQADLSEQLLQTTNNQNSDLTMSLYGLIDKVGNNNHKNMILTNPLNTPITILFKGKDVTIGAESTLEVSKELAEFWLKIHAFLSVSESEEVESTTAAEDKEVEEIIAEVEAGTESELESEVAEEVKEEVKKEVKKPKVKKTNKK